MLFIEGKLQYYVELWNAVVIHECIVILLSTSEVWTVGIVYAYFWGCLMLNNLEIDLALSIT